VLDKCKALRHKCCLVEDWALWIVLSRAYNLLLEAQSIQFYRRLPTPVRIGKKDNESANAYIQLETPSLGQEFVEDQGAKRQAEEKTETFQGIS
jgi:hypothetical protein